MDELIIPGYDEEDAFCKLFEVLIVVANHGLSNNWKKCKFLQKQFLKHIIGNGCDLAASNHSQLKSVQSRISLSPSH